jgi:hypothetical protein
MLAALNVRDGIVNLVSRMKFKVKAVTKLYMEGILVTVASAIALFVSLDFIYSWSQELYTVNIDRVYFMLPMLFVLLKISTFYLGKIKKLEEA